MKKFTKSQLLLTTLLSGAVIGSSALPALAQAVDDEIVVTGTRIKRQDLEATSPVAAIPSEQLAIVNTVNTEEFLNTLPQAVPGFDSTSNNPGTGTATVNLRGLGSARTLVLVDGQRYVSAFGNGVVDLNSIPSSLVKRVDVLTGGSSAVYGSDAMAGVVNFIMIDDFEGVELSGTYQISEKGDGAKKDMGLTIGGNFDGGRGNVTVFAGFSQRDAVFQGDRDFSRVANQDLGAGNGFAPFGSSGVPGTRLFDGFDFTNAGYTISGNQCLAPDGSVAEGLSGTCTGGATFDANGNIIPWINSGQNTTRYNYAPVNYLQLPQDRYTLAAFGRYDITDNVEAKLRTIFTSNVVPQELAPTPFFNTVTIDLATNPFLTPGARNTLIAANGGVAGPYTVFIGRRMLEVGPRNSDQELQSMQITGSLAGQFDFGWNWDVVARIGRTSGSQVQTGNVSISAMRDAVLSGDCNIFGPNVFSQDCVDRVSRTGIIQSVSEQRGIVATTGGAVESFKSPMADNPMDLVLGVEYREDTYDSRPDSVLGPDVAGFNQSLPVAGTTDSYEAFGEINLPLIEGASMAEDLSINGAYRYADNSNAGGYSSYAAGVKWSPVSGIRFRGQYQRAVRAPNVVELFSPQTNGFPQAVDPCSNSGGGPTGQAALCVGSNPWQVTAAQYGTAIQPNSQIEGLFGGNPNLEVEDSDTYTIGAVIQPAAIEGLTLQIDWFDITVNNAIGTIPIQTVLDGCYDGSVPAFCSLINRQGGGIIDFVELNNQNVSFLGVQGVDVQLDYTFDADAIGLGDFGGEFFLQLIGTYKITDEFQALPTDPVDDCVGYHGGNAGICGEPSQEWKHSANLRYSNGPWSINTRWRYLSNTRADDFNPNSLVTPNLFAPETGSASYFDVTGRWDISDTFQLSGGILNIGDRQPPELGDCCSEQANTWPATFRTLGRQFYLGGKVRF